MSDEPFEPVDEAERFDLNAYGAAEAARRRAIRAELAVATPSTTMVAARDLVLGMVPVGAGAPIARLCSDLEAPHLVHVWVEGADDALGERQFPPDELVAIEP